jgi:deoxyribodipyrimidine photo-lyase
MDSSSGNYVYTLSVWWVKRDARIDDNPALSAAVKASKYVLPVAIYEPDVWSSPEFSELHRSCWLGAIGALQKNLGLRGSKLYFLRMTFEEAITRLKSIFPIEAVFSHEEIGSESTFQRDRRIKSFLREHAITWHELPQSGVIRGLRSRDGREKIWKERVAVRPIPIPESLALPEPFLAHEFAVLPSPPTKAVSVSERTARTTLRTFLDSRGLKYSSGISSPNSALHHGSRLSEHLAWGTISIRKVYFESNQRMLALRGDESPIVSRWRRSLRAFQSRLHWHDHFMQRLESEPEMEFQPLNRAYSSLPYEDDPRLLEAWRNGETGMPLIDACMRCLNETGFINFRMRAMVVSYACHVLHLSWRTIMHPLAQLFIDYEPGIHISQLQMQAGVVGINTIRIYNPTKQLREQDPECAFVKKWLPELRKCAVGAIFEHEFSPMSGYHPPVVDFKARSSVMKSALFQLRGDQSTKVASAEVLEKHGSRKRVSRVEARSIQLPLLF